MPLPIQQYPVLLIVWAGVFIYFLRVASSVQHLSVLLECACVISINSNLSDFLATFPFRFISVCFDVVYVWSCLSPCLCCCALVPGTMAFHLLYP